MDIKEFCKKVYNNTIKKPETDEEYVKYATREWIRLLAQKSKLSSIELDTMEELIKSIIECAFYWKDNNKTNHNILVAQFKYSTQNNECMATAIRVFDINEPISTINDWYNSHEGIFKTDLQMNVIE